MTILARIRDYCKTASFQLFREYARKNNFPINRFFDKGISPAVVVSNFAVQMHKEGVCAEAILRNFWSEYTTHSIFEDFKWIEGEAECMEFIANVIVNNYNLALNRRLVDALLPPVRMRWLPAVRNQQHPLLRAYESRKELAERLKNAVRNPNQYGEIFYLGNHLTETMVDDALVELFAPIVAGFINNPEEQGFLLLLALPSCETIIEELGLEKLGITEENYAAAKEFAAAKRLEVTNAKSE